MNEQRSIDLKPIEKIVLFTFVSQLFTLPEYIRELMILNLGWGNIYPLRLYTVGLPALYIFHKNFIKKSFNVPLVVPFLLLFAGFILMESLPFREGSAGYSFIDMIPFAGILFPGREVTYSFVMEQLNIYVFFLLLVNFGLNRITFYKVIDYALYAGIITGIITFIGYLGFIGLGADYYLQEAGLSERPGTMINVNQISYISAFSILLLIIKQLNEKRFSLYYILRDTSIISLLLAMIVINASRGAFIIALILVLYYCFLLWRFGANVGIKSIFLFIIAIVIISALFKGFEYKLFTSGPLKHTYLYQRFFSLSDKETGSQLRKVNLMNALDNIKNHPFVGVGFHDAAKGRHGLGTRSNNQFIQILASSGIFYFFIYIYYNFRLLASRLTLLKKPEVMLSVLFQLIFLLLRRPTTLSLIAISGFIAFYFYSVSKTNQISEQAIPTIIKKPR